VATIGHVRADGDGFTGHFCTLTISRNIALRPNPDKRAENQPDLIIYLDDIFDLGAAWWKSDEKRGDYLFCKLVTPEFEQPILFQVEPVEGKPGLLALCWTPPSLSTPRKP
jgi:uncharacterized protein (DUF736 family)